MTETPTQPIEILLVEDNPADVELTEEALKEARIPNNLHVTRDGVQAMHFLHNAPPFSTKPRPDLIILDLNLPSKDGREVLDEVKRDNDLKSIPVIVMTTSEDEEDIRGVYRRHGNCYICKPVDFDQFLSAMKALEVFWLGTAQLPPREG